MRVLDVLDAAGLSQSPIVASGLGGACHLRLSRQMGKFKDMRIVEISPATFSIAQHRYLPPDSSRQVHLSDLRIYLRNVRDLPGVWIDLDDPYISGHGNLLTTEFLSEAKAALSPRAVLVYWFSSNAVAAFFDEIVATFSAVFPQGMLFRDNETTFWYVIASPQSLAPELTKYLKSQPELKSWLLAELVNPNVHPVTEDRILYYRRFFYSDEKIKSIRLALGLKLGLSEKF